MINQHSFGKLDDGAIVDLFTLENGAGVVLKCINYGGRITELHVPDRNGKSADILLGFADLGSYVGDDMYFGPVCGRYANRLAHGRFTLDGREYHTPINDPGGPNTLHGGPQGFDKKLWAGLPQEHDGEPSVKLTLTSPNLDEGFPGEMHVWVTYTLTRSNELRIEYEATTDRPTIVNLTNHLYWDLGGAGSSGGAADHVVEIAAEQYAPTRDKFIPTGQLAPVKGSPLDLASPAPIGERLPLLPKGFDNTYAIPPDLPPDDAAGLPRIAEAFHPASGRRLALYSDQPALQFYTAGQLKGDAHGIGGKYDRFAALVFEPMHFPDSPHHAAFPSTVLRPGQVFRSTTVYRLGINAG